GAIRDRPTLLPGHGLLTLLTIVTFVAYFAFGIGKYLKVVGTVPMDASPLALPAIPTLACILVLVTLAVYVTAGLAFLLDRFRVPIFLPLIALALASSDWPQSDNYFAVHAMPERRLGVPPDRALSARGGDLAIVVTASGGGVHAAAWTASVVAQLEQQFGARFHQSIPLISAASGGSVGTMYIVSAIEKGGFASDAALVEAFNPASTSSLDDVGWGLVYPDVIRLFAPFLVKLDRGQAAELAWRRLAPDLSRPLTDWRPGALSGAIPAVIFNATLADTGGRLVIGTTDLAYKRGLLTFSALYDEADPVTTVEPAIVTAARLSASFTYVSPAARIDRWVPRSLAYHVVDGGYFDNYGVASAVDWLDAATRGPTTVSHVLVLQIRGPVALQDPAARPSRGTLPQIAAPVSTLLHFHDAAQVAHNNQELLLLCKALAARNVTLETAVFQFPKCSPPLSWHLTQPERDEVWDAYADPVLARPGSRGDAVS